MKRLVQSVHVKLKIEKTLLLFSLFHLIKSFIIYQNKKKKKQKKKYFHLPLQRLIFISLCKRIY